MAEKNDSNISYGLDIMVAIFILVTGVFVLFFGISWMGYVYEITPSPYGPSPLDWLRTSTWIVFMIGIVTIIYSIKRMISDIIRIYS